jgi:ABC-type phosphate/phosphonate transport system substrate-binding protein
LRIAAALIIFSLMPACRTGPRRSYAPEYGRSPAIAGALKKYSFGVPPIGSARSTWVRFSPLISALNASKLGFELRLESGQTVDAYQAKFQASRLDFAIVYPVQVLIAEERGYQVIARAGARDRVRGVIIVRRDSSALHPTALRGKAIAFSAPNDLATMLCQFRLLQSGVNIRKDATPLYTHSSDSALLNVFLRRAAAAGISEEDWKDHRNRQPEREKYLIEQLRTDELPGPAVMSLHSVPAEHQRALRQELLRLSATVKGRAALFSADISDFAAAESASYDEVWEFLGAYRRAFGSAAITGGAK